MRRIILNLVLLVSLLCLPTFAQNVSIGGGNGGNPTISFMVDILPVDDITPENPDKGHRDNPERIPALISENGVAIERVSESGIESYDIYASSGIQVGSFASGAEFAITLFSLEGEYEVRFTTSEYVYIGYVWME